LKFNCGLAQKWLSFDFAEGLACRVGAKANGPLCVGCQRYFHLNLFNFFFLLQNFLWVGKKKNKTLRAGNVCRDLVLCLVCHVLFNGLLTVRRVVSLFR